jgi:hypothetical protein
LHFCIKLALVLFNLPMMRIADVKLRLVLTSHLLSFVFHLGSAILNKMMLFRAPQANKVCRVMLRYGNMNPQVVCRHHTRDLTRNNFARILVRLITTSVFKITKKILIILINCTVFSSFQIMKKILTVFLSITSFSFLTTFLSITSFSFVKLFAYVALMECDLQFPSNLCAHQDRTFPPPVGHRESIPVSPGIVYCFGPK